MYQVSVVGPGKHLGLPQSHRLAAPVEGKTRTAKWDIVIGDWYNGLIGSRRELRVSDRSHRKRSKCRGTIEGIHSNETNPDRPDQGNESQ